MDDKYHPKKIEAEWQQVWDKEGIFKAKDDSDKPPFYILEMFPYPSGKLHMGHVRVYSIGDVLARYYKMRGHEVLHPMGWDALGLPAENAAIKDGVHPEKRTRANIESVRAQMKMLGLSYDWDREFATCDTSYYKWNQWFFIKMFEKDLVYRRSSLSNWCTGCMTVLANEQVVDGKCERCKSTVLQKEMPDWAFRITRYADELLEDLDKLPNWPDRIKTMQRNWIGRSEGCELVFPVETEGVEPIQVFTTRSDTVYGATYMVLAPEHPMVKRLTTDAQREAVESFVERMGMVDKAVRTDASTDKEGVWTGAYAENPFTKERIPIWIANFVLAGYGTGAVMSVPAHDQRDFEFAKRYEIPIRVVIQPEEDEELKLENMEAAFVEDGRLVESGEYSGLSSAEARSAIAKAAEEAKQGGPTVNYHLRDWGVSRQRYWGTPIPMIHCEKCGVVPVPEKDLPVLLPPDAELTGTGEPPLAKVKDFVETTCPNCGGKARRDTDTMDTFVDSTWYFSRYLDPKNIEEPFRRDLADRWLPVDIYVGGPEHAVMHLMYFRFWYKVMRDMGLVGNDEPVDKLLTQGMVVRDSYYCEDHGYQAVEDLKAEGKEHLCGHCGKATQVRLEKMSKSKLNGVSPEAVFEAYGADTMRLFCLFAAPPEKDVEWSDEGVTGCYNFLRRLWRFYVTHREHFEAIGDLDGPVNEDHLGKDLVAFHRQVHRCIQKVTRDIGSEIQFNTAIAAMMELLNASRVLEKLEPGRPSDPAAIEALRLLSFAGRSLCLMMVPFAPHFSEEVWKLVGRDGLACLQPWPEFDEAATLEDVISIAVQVNGKLRAQVDVARDASKEDMEAAARADEKVEKWIADKTERRVIVVSGRLVNFVVT